MVSINNISIITSFLIDVCADKTPSHMMRTSNRNQLGNTRYILRTNDMIKLFDLRYHFCTYLHVKDSTFPPEALQD